MVIIAHLTQAHASTIINAALTITQYTFGLAVVVVLVYFMYNTNSAIAWSGVTRTIHSSFWPTLLRTDSTSSGSTWSRISVISNLSIIGGVLIAIAGVVTPLGLDEGPLVQTDYVLMGASASYVRDESPIGLATPPRDNFTYGRICGDPEPVPCPGNDLNANTTQISPDTFAIFNSTRYGPFNMQSRRYHQGVAKGYNHTMTLVLSGMLEYLILRNGVFAIEGLIVDLTTNPGIGLWNHTLPILQHGGVWSEDVLWLEPVSACVNTNLTIDYRQKYPYPEAYNLTDRGGFVDLPQEPPSFSRDGQSINLYEHAYKAAVLSNIYTMRSYNNMTKNESYIGKAFPSNANYSSRIAQPDLGKMQYLPLAALFNPNVTWHKDPALYEAMVHFSMSCKSRDGHASITNVATSCSLMIGPGVRVDGGDPSVPEDNSTWRQTLHFCASAARARMQRITFSFNATSTIHNLRISRQDTNTSVLWAIEKTNLTTQNVSVFWGRVADSYEHDTSLSTNRSEVFYLPAGALGIPALGGAYSIPAAFLEMGLSDVTSGVDYSGSTNYALLVKWQSLIKADPENGPSQILNMIWTDLAANNIVGTNTATTLDVAPYVASIRYDLRYSIPALLLLCLWLPLFLIATFILLCGRLRLSQLRRLLNQTSMGRVLVGDSAIRASNLDPNKDAARTRLLQSIAQQETGFTATSHLGTKDWTKAVGQTPVAFCSVDSSAESPSRGSLELGAEAAEAAGEQLTMPTAKDGDQVRSKPLMTAQREHLNSDDSQDTVYSESPHAQNHM